MLTFFITLLLILLVVGGFLPVEIRAAKRVYRSIILVWVAEVVKAWHE